MSRALFLVVALFLALSAEALRAARLAIIVEDPRLSVEADLLTTELSKRSDLQLLEREQIVKIRKEQSLAAFRGNDYVKLGNLLGADGVLILDVLDETTRLLVTVRLAAVNPGVLLDVAEYDFPGHEAQEAPVGRQAPATIAGQGSSARTFARRSLADSEEWCKLLVQHLDPLLPKLGVLVKDAVPISTLNIRNAAKTAQSSTIEKQLKFLLFQRLTRQKEIFLLEREKLGTLAEEKSQAGSQDSPFWNGGYLLEAVIDGAGFNANVLTLSVRLSPPDHGSPLNFEVTGPRTNPAAVIDHLAPQLLAALKTKSPAVEWNSREEAERYFEEATWALRWDMLADSAAAVESAWALGKTDSKCATLRVENYVKLATVNASYGQNRRFDILRRQWVPLAADPKLIRLAARAMAAYQEFSATLAAGDLKPDSEWCYLGIRTLERASEVLQLFHSFPNSESAVADELADLRLDARTTAEWMNRAPKLKESLWRPSKISNENDLMALAVYTPNILRCELDNGCFWQERPEDCLALYRELMRSPVYYYIHHELALRSPQSPRLTGWSEGERRRAPFLWEGFLNELSASTNLHLRIEADFLRLADETTDAGQQGLVNRLMTNLFETGPPAPSDSAPLLYMQWAAGRLVDVTSWTGVPYETGQRLARPWTEHQQQLRIAQENSSFEAQKQYLQKNTPYNPLQFAQTFYFSSYSKAQASELHPLLISYRSNLLQNAALQNDSRNWTNFAIEALRSVEYRIGEGLGINPNLIASWMQPVPATIAQTPQPVQSVFHERTNTPFPPQASRPPRNPGPVRPPSALAATSSIVGTAFHQISESLQNAPDSSVVVHGHRVSDDKLWLELRFGNRSEWHSAIAVFDPALDTWDIIRCPGTTQNTAVHGQPVFMGGEPESSLCFQPYEGALYVSQWTDPLRKFDLKTRRWEILPIPVEKQTQLFAVNARLFGANDEAIFEILEGGHSTRLLASSRRRPVSSRLDSFHSLGEVILFPGPANSLRAFVADKVFDWDGNDWNQTAAFRNAAPPAIFPDGALFRCQDPTASLWLLPHTENRAKLCWRDKRQTTNSVSGRTRLTPLTSDRSNNTQTPMWNTELSGNAAVAVLQSNLCIVSLHTVRSNFMADLTWLGHGEPLTLHLRLGYSDRTSFSDAARPFELTTYIYRRPWIEFTSDALILGLGRWNGVWTIPRAGLITALASERDRLSHAGSGAVDSRESVGGGHRPEQ